MSLRSRLVITVTVVAFFALVAADFVTYTSLGTVLTNQVDSTLDRASAAILQTLAGHPPGPVAGQPGGPNGLGMAGGAGEAGRPHPGQPGSAGPGSAPAGSAGPGSAPAGSAGPGSAPAGSAGPGSAPAGSAPATPAPRSGSALCAESSEQGGAPGTFLEVRTSAGRVVSGDECPAYEAGGAAYSPQLPTPITGFQQQGPALVTYFSAPPAGDGGPGFRVRASEIAGGALNGDQLVLGLPTASDDSTLNRLLDIELAVTGGALVVALALGWWLVRLELLPLRRVESTAASIAAGDWSHRVPGERARTEVGRVARALNAMLAAIEEAFAERDAIEGELRASEERLRRFVADASHELRTPIAAISAYAQLVGRADRREEDLPRVVSGIRLESARMAGLVADLLLLARLDDQRTLRGGVVELVDLAAGAVETARAVGPGWPVRLVASDAVEVEGDEVQLRQVLDNLLANVRAHTPEGTPATVAVRSEGGDAILEVSDDGPGIAPEQAARVFERFFRADASRARATGGSGLGLAIVRAIAEAHGGSASLRSAPGEGATFTIRLRRSATANGGATGVAGPGTSSAAAPGPQGRTDVSPRLPSGQAAGNGKAGPSQSPAPPPPGSSSQLAGDPDRS